MAFGSSSSKTRSTVRNEASDNKVAAQDQGFAVGRSGRGQILTPQGDIFFQSSPSKSSGINKLDKGFLIPLAGGLAIAAFIYWRYSRG